MPDSYQHQIGLQGDEPFPVHAVGIGDLGDAIGRFRVVVAEGGGRDGWSPAPAAQVSSVIEGARETGVEEGWR